MNKIKHIKNTKYYAISQDSENPWIMKPIPANAIVFRFGDTPSGLAWFFDPREGLFVYDIHKQSLLLKKRLPNATSDVLGKKGETCVTFDQKHYAILQSPDGNHLYYIIAHDHKFRDLYIIDIKSGNFVKTIKSLYGGFQPANHCRLDNEGRILFAALIRDEKQMQGLVRVNPQSGEVETSVCKGSYASEWLHSPSPNGQYWLRSDNSQIPHVREQAKNRTFFGFRAKRGHPKEFFSFALEVWSSFPLKHIATVAPMWLSPHELPDAGNLDKELYSGNSIDRSVDIGILLEGKHAKRTKIFGDISAYLKENPEKNWTSIASFKEGETEWLWPEKKGYYENIGRNLSTLQFSTHDFIGWQPDNQAFWVKRNSFIACVGIDGTVSPKIKFERYGMEKGTSLPYAALFKSAEPLAGRSLKVLYKDGTVIADGSPEAPTTAIRTIPVTSDHHTPVVVDATAAEQEEKLAEKADALDKKKSVYRIELNALDETGCISAIEALTAEINPDINQRPYDNYLEAIFVHGRKELNEQEFFSHVEQNCPASAMALNRLIQTICEHATSLDSAYYDPYEEKTGTSIGAFGFAALCLAKLDPNSNEVLLKYGALIDTYHEHFYLPTIFKVMLTNETDIQRRLSMVEGVLLGGLGNNFGPYGFWKFTEMGEMASSIFPPSDYAKRIFEKDNQIKASDLNTNLMGPILARMGNEMQKSATDWEKAMLHELASMI